jgi:hypothetical protein
MFFATITNLFQRLRRSFRGDLPSRGRRTGSPRRFVPELCVLEDRALPSGIHGPLTAIIPHDLGPIGLAHSSQPGHTITVPFKVDGGGPAPNGLSVIPGSSVPHSATGQGTMLGHYTGDGAFTLDTIDFATLTGTFHGTFTFVAANGDKLVMNYGDGTFSLTPPDADGKVVATFVAVFTPVPDQCTGRFANVVGGSFVMVATSEPFVLSVDSAGFTPPFDYTWVGDGTLEFARG